MRLIVVSGLSGAGKSIALGVLEDSGYYVVDNLPATLFTSVVDYLGAAGHLRVGVSVDARSAALASLADHVAALRGRGIDCSVIFLQASDETLLRRYAETRRRHPLSGELTLAEAITRERAMLEPLAAMLEPLAGLGHRVDTTGTPAKALRNWIRELIDAQPQTRTLLFESFGYAQGIPLDADWVIDARMLPNPHYDPALRPLTGRDAPVVAYLGAQEPVQRFFEDVRAFLERWLPEVERDNRSYLTVAVGCTGGRHRSVYLVERLAASFRGRWSVLVRHRGLAAQDEAGGA
ncbi:MAG: RNase adapter RapZ [Betaproteobacteria bacterium]|nr:RNase adapter RapZ [Betaproteobacteria bacterium]